MYFKNLETHSLLGNGQIEENGQTVDSDLGSGRVKNGSKKEQRNT